MASIDKAFIKAYAREESRPPAVNAAPAAVPAAPPVTTNKTIPAPHVSIEALAKAAAAAIAQEAAAVKTVAAPPVSAPTVEQAPATQWRIDRSHRTRPTTPETVAPQAETPAPERPAILPLSTFTQSVAARQALRPAFEVDRFVWPSAVQKLLRTAGQGLADLAAELQTLPGPRVIGITGVRRGIGQSSLLLALARKCAAAKYSTAIVDADFQSAQMARQTGLAVRIGLDDVLAGEAELADVLVESLEDGLTLLPLKEKLFEGIELKDKFRMPSALGSLGDHYEVTLVDAGPMTNLDRPRVHCLTGNSGLTGILLIRDLRHDSDADIEQAAEKLAQIGLPCHGIIENFAK